MTSPLVPQRSFVIRPEDERQGWRIAKMAVTGLRAAVGALKQGANPVEVVIREWKPERTDPQRKTMWMWHGQVASELSIRTGTRWHKDDVHEYIFLPRWMPVIERMDPETGEILHRPMRTSDKPPEGEDRSTKQIISEAMTAYLAWIYEMGIEVNVPESGW